MPHAAVCGRDPRRFSTECGGSSRGSLAAFHSPSFLRLSFARPRIVVRSWQVRTGNLVRGEVAGIGQAAVVLLIRPVIQGIITPAALREHDVHAVPNERLRWYTKLSWEPSSRAFCDLARMCDLGRMLVCRVLHKSVSIPANASAAAPTAIPISNDFAMIVPSRRGATPRGRCSACYVGFTRAGATKFAVNLRRARRRRWPSFSARASAILKDGQMRKEIELLEDHANLAPNCIDRLRIGGANGRVIV
jgi:hypothetical protein